jgi:hypothetical protein
MIKNSNTSTFYHTSQTKPHFTFNNNNSNNNINYVQPIPQNDFSTLLPSKITFEAP